MDFIADWPTVAATVRRNIPSCFAVEDVDYSATAADSGNPAFFQVVARIRRITEEPEPAGWGYSLSKILRARWGPTEFALIIRERPSELEQPAG